jgi:histidinol phosphatase-like PHP family hydrolase
MHTDETDGASTVAEMAEAAAALGASASSSPTTPIKASGRAFSRASEMDLSPEGGGDMDPAALASLDLVLGAFNSELRLRDDQTERYFRGLANPDIQVLAHPRSRSTPTRIARTSTSSVSASSRRRAPGYPSVPTHIPRASPPIWTSGSRRRSSPAERAVAC